MIRNNKIFREQYGGIVFLVPFIDSITILSTLVQETSVDTILFHEELYIELIMNTRWQIGDPSTTFYAFDLHHNKQTTRIVENELNQILVSIFKYITVGSNMEETIADPVGLTKTMIDELYPILDKKGLKFMNFGIIKIEKIDPIEFQKIKSKYQRLNLRKHESDKELNKEIANFELGGQEVYVRAQMWG